MFKRWKRTRPRPLRDEVGVTAAKTNASAQRNQAVLDAIWEALNIARDNKALVIARAGTIINVNRLVSQLCERSLDQLVGRRIATELFDGPSAPAAERWEAMLKTSSGSRIGVEVIRQSLDAHLPELEVYAIRDLRERHKEAEEQARQSRALQQREEELRAQNEKFDAALDNMLQGLAMFDAEQRLIVCNRRYAEMYGLTAEQVKPGTTVRQIFEYRLANGFYQSKTAKALLAAGSVALGTYHRASRGWQTGASYASHATRCRTAVVSSHMRTSRSARSLMPNWSSSTSASNNKMSNCVRKTFSSMRH